MYPPLSSAPPFPPSFPRPSPPLIPSDLPPLPGGLVSPPFHVTTLPVCRRPQAGRSHEPTAPVLWEGMGQLASLPSSGPGDAAYADAMDAFEHAVLLGGGLESRLAVANAAVQVGGGGAGGTGRRRWDGAGQVGRGGAGGGGAAQ
eukprot:14623-Chlamydomonas_euryale.AAC.2